MDYNKFIESKQFKIKHQSIEINRNDLSNKLFDYQKDLVYIALKRGKSAIFAMTGTGKTAMEIEWSKHVSIFTKKPTLILAPLSIAPQTKQESMDIFQKDAKHGNINWYGKGRLDLKGLFD